MLLLHTSLGSFILNNAVKIDCYTEKRKEVWDVFLAVDSCKQLLVSFSVKEDAYRFLSHFKNALFDALTESSERRWTVLGLDKLLHDACNKIIEGEN